MRPRLLVALLFVPSIALADWSVDERADRLLIHFGDVAVVEYVFADPVITRPYFAGLRTPEGVQVTRHHPPIAGEDRMDHPEFHPGVWLAFGDLSGADNWRLKAAVEHLRFIKDPTVENDGVHFAVENRYLDADGLELCRAIARHRVARAKRGILLTYDVTLSGTKDFHFGDQEEMGLGVRLATPLRVEKQGPDPAIAGTGEIAADGGRRGSASVWGQPAAWLDYRGEIEGAPAGLALFCHPENFRASRMHARDYGFVCANPFALAAFNAGPADRTVVPAGESLRLRYGVLAHSGERLTDAQLDAAYNDYADERP